MTEDGELFAGPGGWDVAARLLGVHPKGLEWDDAACATAQAASHARLQADVAASDPQTVFPNGVRLLIGSPPCQAFSAAGKGKGRAGSAYILMGVNLIAWGNDPVQVCKWVDEKLDDPRAALVLEPLRYAKDLRPEHIALEQVPTVLPLWEAMAEVLRSWGYSIWCGNLQAEQYDVPQTRKRAILLASRVREVSCPPPVRRKYRKGTAQNEVHKLDAEGLQPWISMSQALGWGGTARPGYTILAGGTDTGGAEPFGNGARQQMVKAQDRGEWSLRSSFSEKGSNKSAPRSVEEPAATITTKHRSADWVQRRNSGPGAARDPRPADEPSYTIRAQGSGSHPSGTEWELRMNTQEHAAVRSTVFFGERKNNASWVQRSNYNGSPTQDGSPRERTRRALEEPSVALTSKPGHWEPQVMGDVRQANGTVRSADKPTGTITAAMDNGNHQRQATTAERVTSNSVRVTVQEAATLQGFPSGYPWQGNKSAQYRQVGDAMPPPLAWHVLRALFGLPVQHYPGTEHL